jgi:hypothetical protein
VCVRACVRKSELILVGVVMRTSMCKFLVFAVTNAVRVRGGGGVQCTKLCVPVTANDILRFADRVS